MDKELLVNYAKLIAKVGANVQKGQYVVIRLTPDQEWFASLVAEECYKLGARRVCYEWRSSVLSRVDYKYGTVKGLSRSTEYDLGFQRFMTDDLPVLIWIDAEDPDGYLGVDAKKMAAVAANRYRDSKGYIEARENKYQWAIAGGASLPWAHKMFPKLSDDEAMEALWDAILVASRARDGNGIHNWDLHEKELKRRRDQVNALRLTKLHYTSSNGTDLTVGLIPRCRFEAGGETTMDGTPFSPNIPSEECFTSPKRGVAEGVVHNSKPLVYNGQVIDGFWLRFHEGRAVEAHAKKGEKVLKSILSLDEGSSYLGECALVPYDSPINKTGLLFYSTLYDENAACHLALGRGFPNLYPGYEKMSQDELFEIGINRSMTHVDFMIGTADLRIVGTKEDGTEVTVFDKGNWALQ
jgi:aminopeptidase